MEIMLKVNGYQKLEDGCEVRFRRDFTIYPHATIVEGERGRVDHILQDENGRVEEIWIFMYSVHDGLVSEWQNRVILSAYNYQSDAEFKKEIESLLEITIMDEVEQIGVNLTEQLVQLKSMVDNALHQVTHGRSRYHDLEELDTVMQGSNTARVTTRGVSQGITQYLKAHGVWG